MAPGVVKVRVIGAQEDVDALTSVLECLAADLPVTTVGVEILDRSAPHPNRRDPGERVSLSVLVRTGGDQR
jgi:hypothetical protein